MSSLVANPDILAIAVTDVAGIRSALSAANAAVATPIVQVQVAAADEVLAAAPGGVQPDGQAHEGDQRSAIRFHDQFAQLLSNAGSSYALAEAANTSPLQSLEQNLLNAVNAPTEAFRGRPLIGNGADGTTVNGVGTRGGDGGYLIGQRRKRRR